MRPGAWLLLALLPALWSEGGSGNVEPSWRLGRPPRAYALDNGLSVVLQRDESAAITVVQLRIGSGDRDDPPGMPGLAYLAARLGLEVTDPVQLRRLMEFGSSFSLSVGGDQTLITLRSLSRHLDPSLPVLTAMLGDPLFSDLRVKGVKELMGRLQRLENEDPVDCMRRTVAAAFYGIPAYGAARFGDEASLDRIGRRDIQSFYRSHFVAGNMVAVVISDLEEVRIMPLLARCLGVFPAGKKPPARPVPLSSPPHAAQAIERQAEQALISRSVLLPSLSGDSFALAFLLENWLGKGVGSRLWRLRSREGLAYGLHAGLQPNREAMVLNVYLQTDRSRSGEAQAELEQLLRSVHDDGIGSGELTAAKAHALADFWRDIETREHRAAILALLEGGGLSHRFAGDFAARLDAITLEEFNAFLRDWLAPGRWFSLRIGPLEGNGTIVTSDK